VTPAEKRMAQIETLKQQGREDRFKNLQPQLEDVDYMLGWAEEDAKHKLIESFISNNQPKIQL